MSCPNALAFFIFKVFLNFLCICLNFVDVLKTI